MKEEIKTLYREGHRTGGGVLARQAGDTMKGYIERRRLWWTLLSFLDKNIGADSSLTDEFRGDLLLGKRRYFPHRAIDDPDYN